MGDIKRKREGKKGGRVIKITVERVMKRKKYIYYKITGYDSYE